LSTNENFTKVLKLAKSCADGKSRLVFSSTAAVYGDTDSLPTVESTEKNPQSPYGLSKYCVEQYLALFGSLYSLDWAALRYFNVYGPAQPGDSPYSTVVSAWCTKALNNEPLRSDGDGNQTRDMVHVDDVVSANIIVANTTSLEERIFNVGSGKAVSNNQIREFFVERGYDQVVHAETRKGDVRHTLSDTSKLEKLGWNCIYSFSEGIKNVLNYWKL
jgi:UDP-glucose 4-epimerase